jgi:hypothetical protein
MLTFPTQLLHLHGIIICLDWRPNLLFGPQPPWHYEQTVVLMFQQNTVFGNDPIAFFFAETCMLLLGSRLCVLVVHCSAKCLLFCVIGAP